MDRHLSDEQLDRAIVGFLLDRRVEIEATAMSSYQAASQVRDGAEPGHAPGRLMVRTLVGRPFHATRSNAMATVLKVAAVAAFALAVGLGVSILPRSPDIGAAPAPSPSATPEPAPLREGLLRAGTYTTTPFAAPGSDACLDQADCLDRSDDDSIEITFTVPDGWTASGADGVYLDREGDPPAGAALIFVRGASLADDPCHNDGSGDIPVGPTVDDFVDALAAHPLLDVTDPVDITLGGRAGKYLELLVPSDPTIQGSSEPASQEGCPVYRPWNPWYLAQGPGERWHLSVVDVDGVRVVIQAVVAAGTTAARQAELQAIVDSIQISESPEASASAAPPSDAPKPEESVTALVDRVTGGPTLGTDIPAGAPAGVIDTPIGPARWVHLSTPTATLPEEVLASGAEFVDLDRRQKWTSQDGMRWTSESISVPVESGSWWDWASESEWWSDNDSGPDAKRLWRTTDGATWTPIDVSAVIPKGHPAIGWELEWMSGASTEAVAAVEIDLEASEPFASLGWYMGSTWPAEEVEPGVFSIPARGRDDPEVRQRFETVPGGLRVTDESDGSLVTTLEGVTLEDVRGWVRDGQPAGHLIAMLDGDRLVPIATAESMTTPERVAQHEGIPMAGVGDGIVALALADPSGPAVAWRLDETGAWTELGPWDIPEGAAGGTFVVTSNYPGLIDGTEYAFYAGYHAPGSPTQTTKAWRSADGLHWDQFLESPLGAIAEVGPGFVAMQWVGQGRALWASADGRTWTKLDLSGLDLPSDLSSLSMTGAGDALFLVNNDGRREWWVLGFDGTSA